MLSLIWEPKYVGRQKKTKDEQEDRWTCGNVPGVKRHLPKGDKVSEHLQTGPGGGYVLQKQT